jgi:site-specific DNA-methyltransferase (adenine-specific)
VFGKGRVSYGGKNPKRPSMKYNPQKTFGHSSYSQKSGKQSDNWKGGLNNVVTTVEDGSRHPKTVQSFHVGKDKGLHPTQKPISLLEFLIKSYTDEGDLVFDPTIGSGTSMAAAKQLNRNGIGCELNDKYFKICEDRINSIVVGSSLEVSNEQSEKIITDIKSENILF